MCVSGTEKCITENYNKIIKEVDDLDFSDIKKYFSDGEKDDCISDKLEDNFSKNKGKEHVKDVFSVFLLGIYCYDNILTKKNSFTEFVSHIGTKTKKATKKITNHQLETERRNDFLYLWFLTALFHDMGCLYKCKKDNDNSFYSFIITRRNMMSKENLGFLHANPGIPQKLRFAAKHFFWNRRNNFFFNENLCTDSFIFCKHENS